MMMRIIFDDGTLIDCKHINKIYIEEADLDKLTIVGNIKDLEEKDERSTD